MKTNRSKKMRNRRIEEKMLLRSIVLISAMASVIMMTVYISSISMQAKDSEYTLVIEELQQKLQEEENRTLEIVEYEKYTESDEYVEKVAREKLGMAYPDEYILVAAE